MAAVPRDSGGVTSSENYEYVDDLQWLETAIWESQEDGE